MPRVLLIDDDPGVLAASTLVMEDVGFEVVAARSGGQGVLAALSAAPDVILSELNLPDVSGLEVLRNLRDLHVDGAFVIVTGSGSTSTAVDAMRLGAADYVEKPLVGDDLLRVVRCAPGRNRCARVDCAWSHVIAPAAPAASRWAHVLMPAVHSAKDPRTLEGWARCASVSPGAIKTWCRTAGVSTRRSLVFARLIRAVLQRRDHGCRPEDMLDVVDHRTLAGLLTLGGITTGNPADLSTDLEELFSRQSLIVDVAALTALRGALGHFFIDGAEPLLMDETAPAHFAKAPAP